MGGEPWRHVAPYQSDIPSALEALRQREFADGDYRGSEAEPASIEEALENMDADGTASILDIDHVADHPEPMGVTVLTPSEAKEYSARNGPRARTSSRLTISGRTSAAAKPDASCCTMTIALRSSISPGTRSTDRADRAAADRHARSVLAERSSPRQY